MHRGMHRGKHRGKPGPVKVLGEAPSKSAKGGETGGRGTERRWARPRTEGLKGQKEE